MYHMQVCYLLLLLMVLLTLKGRRLEVQVLQVTGGIKADSGEVQVKEVDLTVPS